MTIGSDPGRRLLVSPYSERTLTDLDGEGYRWALGSLGYEPRCVAIPTALAACPGSAVAFENSRVGAFDDNRRRFKEIEWNVVEAPERDFLSWLKERLDEHAAFERVDRDERPRIAIDVSSMTRTRIAAVVQALSELAPHRQIGADLLYAPAQFRKPEAPPPAILRRSIVSPYFAGSLGMDQSIVIVGLGYEQHKVGSTIEDFGPSRVVAFVPEGPDGRYLSEVLRVNRVVLDPDGPVEVHEVRYKVGDPYATLQQLEAACYELLTSPEPQMPMLIPLGPKIFATCCMVAAALHPEHVAVWRVSYREKEHPTPTEASGQVVGVRLDVPPLSDS